MSNLTDPEHPVWDLAKDALAYIPALIAMVCTTQNWDGEYLVMAMLAAGAGGKYFLGKKKAPGDPAATNHDGA